MAAHIYMSANQGAPQPDGSIAFAADASMRYRGEVGPTDDPVGFARQMAARAHLVRVVGSFHGVEVTLAELE